MSDLENPSESEFPILLRTREEAKPCLCLWLLQVAIVIGSSSVVIWLSLTPKSPIYIITGAYVPTLDGRNSTSLDGRNTSTILNLKFSNPNKKMGIFYNNINITLYYSNAVIGSSSLPGFYQGHKKTTIYEVLVNADQQLWQRVTNATTGLRVCLENVVKYKIFSYTTKHHRIYNQAHVPLGSDGRISGEKNIKLK
jgi:hypothetical protein